MYYAMMILASSALSGGGDTYGDWPNVDALHPGGRYILVATDDVRAACVEFTPINHAGFRVQTFTERRGTIVGEVFTIPPDLKDGKYRIDATLYGDRAFQLQPWIAEISGGFNAYSQ